MVNDGQEELYSEYLKMFGSYTIDELRARLFVDQAAQVFDRALAIKKSKLPYEWKLDPCIRPYLVARSLEMLEEGGHRESIFWIALFFMISSSVIHQDDTEEEKENIPGKLLNSSRKSARGIERGEVCRLLRPMINSVYGGNCMFKVLPNGLNRLDFEFEGKLNSDDMREALDELIDKSWDIESGRMLYRIGDFEFPTLGALMIELSRLPELLKLIKKFDRVAVLTEKKWVQKVSEFEGMLIPGLEIKAFDLKAEEEAEAWLTE